LSGIAISVAKTKSVVSYSVTTREGENMKDMKDMIDQVLKNKSLTIFLGIVVLALLFGWIGG